MSAQIFCRTFNQDVYQTLLASGIAPLQARLYAARQVKNADETQDNLKTLLPFDGLKNINTLCTRLAAAIRLQERIVIVADYDADGATACALGVKGLRSMGGVVDFLVPNRFEHGYGLSPALAQLAADAGAQVLLTVDNGIAALAGVERAQQLGIDVLITDHHLPGDTLPDCVIVNPNQPDDAFASKALAGVGVMFYVLCALRRLLREQNHFNHRLPEPVMAQWLDLVALGTVADVVTLDHNNRILVAQGLKRIRSGKMCIGIRALFHIAKRDWRKAACFDLGFAVAPRLNAAGRLDDMSLGIACLLAETETQANALAAQLDNLNRERRQIEHGMLDEALMGLNDINIDQRYSAVVYRNDWHQGVIGIVAGRLRERFNRPAIVFAPADNDKLRGSGRSIAALHLRDALDLVSKREPDLIIQFGGHAAAAGLTISQANFPRFQAAFEAVCQEYLQPEDLNQHYLTDGTLNADELTLQHARELGAAVWGQGFAPPCFHDNFEVRWQKAVGSGHLKAGLCKDGKIFEAMFFRCTDILPDSIRAVYRPIANEWQQQQELQLYVDYWEVA
ncbi:single-stranded-DNA-specific exonuclease RecJ [Stenoxybacter acetivorans]|uniref:single-stranded-DNA-specific exonuclease RecJ n=1 Tax=Stenoxybacter acetivorans TaxID=422441 RepID=UPI00055C5DFF|nr:single-stranded-DNA-specific exonuclease RecJ [Stenoxybacter acetivorans]